MYSTSRRFSPPILSPWLMSPRRGADKLKYQAGSESGMGAWIGDIPPEVQAEQLRAAIARADADNLLLWRMNRARLDAECVRDAVLAASGRLDRRMGGPSVKHFVQSPGIHVTPKVDYDSFDVDAPGACRRSVYRFVFRTLPDPFLDALDCPDASQFSPARSSSITALQALAMLNDRFMVRQAEHFADRLHRESGDQIAAQIRALVLHRALRHIEEKIAAGETNAADLIRSGLGVLAEDPEARLD